jgi:hypothetical protein
MDVGSPDRGTLNFAEYRPGRASGHYESWYLRANHPARPLAFWIRYTIFAPAGRPADAVGQLWAVAFDGETGKHATAQCDVPMGQCAFPAEKFDVRVGTSVLDWGRARGSAGEISWELAYSGASEPLLLFEPARYRSGLPRAKTLVPLPLALFTGWIDVGGRRVDVDGWTGSQNHNWGSEHTARYAYGQVAGFDGEPGAFLDVTTAKAHVGGPLLTPWLTFVVLREGGREHRATALLRAVKATASYDQHTWTFTTRTRTAEIGGTISAPDSAFVTLQYPDPPGGAKVCRNTKIAAAEVIVRDLAGGATRRLHAAHRGLFEILS